MEETQRMFTKGQRVILKGYEQEPSGHGKILGYDGCEDGEVMVWFSHTGAEGIKGRESNFIPEPADWQNSAGITPTFPNPLQIPFGTGRFHVFPYVGDEGHQGVCIRDTGKPHGFDEDASGELPDGTHYPQPGEVYLGFANVESAIVLGETILKVIDRMQGREPATPSEPTVATTPAALTTQQQQAIAELYLATGPLIGYTKHLMRETGRTTDKVVQDVRDARGALQQAFTLNLEDCMKGVVQGASNPTVDLLQRENAALRDALDETAKRLDRVRKVLIENDLLGYIVDTERHECVECGFVSPAGKTPLHHDGCITGALEAALAESGK